MARIQTFESKVHHHSHKTAQDCPTGFTTLPDTNHSLHALITTQGRTTSAWKKMLLTRLSWGIGTD